MSTAPTSSPSSTPNAADMPNGVSKADLPTKLCPVCRRPFAWRKKWARDWDQVKYCSDACRRKGTPDG
jgi:hypothetical protein